jgi:ATP-binding cassette subfamily B protein
VTFEYVENKPVLKDFSLAVQAGQKIALVGETGSGKSTIVNLACHFYEPSQGTIRIEGEDYRNIPLEHLYANLGYVLQTPYLFTGTIRENIRYGRLDASDEEVEAAARNVFADEFIRGLEKGYDTEVGEGGTLLSVGQKQLISFARAVIADPAFLILDEATSSVDTETEKLIQKALAEVLKGRTSFIIAHRLSTIVDADVIVVLRHGTVLEQGRHAELMKAKGYYWKLFTSQFIEKAESEVLGFTLSFDEEPEETSA